MATLSDSFRLADLALSRRGAHSPSGAVCLPSENLADFATAAVMSVPALEADAWLAGRDAAEKLTHALSRPSRRIRTAAEDLAEERINALTHGLGAAFSAAGLFVLLSSALAAGGPLLIASCAVYGATLVLMYVASTLMHAVQEPRRKLRFQLFDHVAIYLLIAGTYTPFMAALLQGTVGFSLLACVWLFAAVGIAIKVRNADRLEETSPLPCVALGWIGLLAIKPLLAALPTGGMVLLMAGGVSFSIGVLFYCRDDKPYYHAIWHLFVMAGTALHFGSIWLYIAA